MGFYLEIERKKRKERGGKGKERERGGEGKERKRKERERKM